MHWALSQKVPVNGFGVKDISILNIKLKKLIKNYDEDSD